MIQGRALVPAGHCIIRREQIKAQEEEKEQDVVGYVSCGAGWHVSLHSAWEVIPACAFIPSAAASVVRRAACTHLITQGCSVGGCTVLQNVSAKKTQTPIICIKYSSSEFAAGSLQWRSCVQPAGGGRSDLSLKETSTVKWTVCWHQAAFEVNQCYFM